jgi:lysyl endopeptidase
MPVVFRLFNPSDGDHFYTDSSREAATAVVHGYVEEGVPFAADSDHPGLVDVFRFFNSGTGDHFYTIDPGERDALIAAGGSNPYGYQYEGVAFSASGQHLLGTEPIHRFYSPLSGDHLYTADLSEGAAGHHIYEGVAWYADVF